MGTKSSHIWVVVTFWAAVLLAFGSGTVRGEVVSVDLALVPPADPANVLTGTLIWQSGMGQFYHRDTDSTNLSGNVVANLTARYDSVSHEVMGIDGIEFTGDRILFSDMSFTFRSDASLVYTLTGLAGYLDTPTPPGTVQTGGRVRMQEQVLTFNEGVCRSYDGSTYRTEVDFFAKAVTTDLTGTGSITASLDSISGTQATYNVSLTLPMYFDALLIDRYMSGTYLNLEGTGTLEAEGRFVRIIPEPATVALLALGWVALARRRRG